MPNWCDNSVTLRHKDISKVDALAAVLENSEDQNIFNHLRPNPSGEWQYDWSCENWGTKWDASIIDWERRDENEVWISMNTAWSPPTTLYAYLVDQGWEVDAVYHEGGMGYAGLYTTEDGEGFDDYYEYDVTDESSIDNLPNDIVEFAGLEDAHRDWVINELEDQWGDAERTEWIPATTPPVRDGWYEVKTAGWDFPHFCKYSELLEWETYNEVTEWRGLAEDPDAWDPVAELEKLKVEFDETKVD